MHQAPCTRLRAHWLWGFTKPRAAPQECRFPEEEKGLDGLRDSMLIKVPELNSAADVPERLERHGHYHQAEDEPSASEHTRPCAAGKRLQACTPPPTLAVWNDGGGRTSPLIGSLFQTVVY